MPCPDGARRGPRREDGALTSRRKSNRAVPRYTISIVAERYGIHPQTLRLYEREGLLKPSRTEGNTRLYSDEDLEQVEVILALTRELGVNLAGVEIILHMRRRMDRMQRGVEEIFAYLNEYLGHRTPVSGSEEGLLPRHLADLLRLGRQGRFEEE
jgi:MerR family transcriptional regulator/heat shock protein HspR